MQLRFIQCIITTAILCEAKKRRPGNNDQKIVSDPDDIPNTGDVYPERFIPVPFGHIYKDGFQHPAEKQPIDLMEFDREYARNSVVSNYEPTKKEKPKGFASPKDEVYFGEKEVEVNKKDDTRKWLDVASNHAANIGMSWKRLHSNAPNSFRAIEETKQQSTPAPDNIEGEPVGKEKYFSRSSFDFDVKKKEYSHYNWTTCDEFGRVADFHPHDVINIEWVPFYTWSSNEIHRTVSIVHRFTYPTKKLVQKYKEQLGPYLNKTLDWELPKLLMKADLEMLLVAADRKGGFDGIPFNEVPNAFKSKNITLPMVNLRLKIVDPYLALMFCDYQYAIIMAISGTEPTTFKEMISEAARLKFKGRGHPVIRDLKTEMLVKQMEKEREIQRERERFINAEDQAEAENFF